jgi:hypothetical protein
MKSKSLRSKYGRDWSHFGKDCDMYIPYQNLTNDDSYHNYKV